MMCNYCGRSGLRTVAVVVCSSIAECKVQSSPPLRLRVLPKALLRTAVVPSLTESLNFRWVQLSQANARPA